MLNIWIYNQKLIDPHFNWQNDYWAVGVSESLVEAVRKYIHSQKEHHRNISFSEEIDQLMKKYGWK